MKDKRAVEVVIYKLKPGVTDSKATQVFEESNELLKTYRGFVSRQLAQAADGTWMDTVLWESMDAAKFAAAEVMKNPKAQDLFSILDETQLNFYHFVPVAEYVNEK